VRIGRSFAEGDRTQSFPSGYSFGILILAVVIGPPAIGAPPDPGLINADTRPDWYLLWYFAILAICPSSIETAVILGAPLFIGALLRSPPLLSNKGERSARKRPWAIAIVVMTIVMISSLWIVGARSPWSPKFDAPPLTEEVVGATSGPVAEGARLFHAKGCLSCHQVDGFGGRRGPNLSRIGDLLDKDQITIRISNGGTNMPSFASTLTPEELDRLVVFVASRRAKRAPLPSSP